MTTTTTTTTTGPAALTDAALHADGDPHTLWRWMREHSPVHHHPATDLPAFWSVTRHTDVRAVYRDAATFSSAHGVLLRPVAAGTDPGGGLTLALTDPPRHHGLRALVAPWFDQRTGRELQVPLRSTVRAALAPALDGERCEVVHDIAGRLSIGTIGTLLGVHERDLEDVFRWTEEAYAAHLPLAAHRELMEYFSGLVEERMDDPCDDVATALAHGDIDEEPLSEAEILLNMENLVGATENGRLAIAGGVLAFLERPDQWERLRADRDLLPSAIEEILRYTSSATHSMRTVTTDTRVGDTVVAAGDRVVLWLPSANRDADVFPEPDRFDIARRPNRHLALGGGEHFCLGSTLIRTQVRVLLTELLDAGVTAVADGPVHAVRSIAVNGPAVLPVRLVR